MMPEPPAGRCRCYDSAIARRGANAPRRRKVTRGPRGPLLIFAFVAAWTVLAVAPAAGAPPAEPGAGRVIAVLPPRAAPASPGAGDFDLAWAGSKLSPVAVAPSAGSWRVAIYFDSPLAAPEGIDRAARALAERAAELTELGAVEILAAEPWPVRRLEPTRDPGRVREALSGLVEGSVLAGELLWQRQRFEALPAAPVPDVQRAERAIREERSLLERQREALLAWAGGAAHDGPRALLLVSDGWDVDSGAYYRERAGLAPEPDPTGSVAVRELSQALAADGWTVVPLVFGDRAHELLQPREPLERLASASGGEIVTRPRDLATAIEALGRRVSLRLEPAAEGAPGVAPLLVRYAGSKRGVRAPRWAAPGQPPAIAEAMLAAAAAQAAGERSAAAAPRPALRLVPPPGERHTGRVRIEAVAARAGIDRVRFLLDGEEAAVVDRPPFRTRIDLGDAPRPRTVEAEARSASGALLGADTLDLNRPEQPFAVRISAVEPRPELGGIEVRAEVRVPWGGTLESVDFYWNDTLVSTLDRGPFATKMAVTPGPDDYLRVVARLADGSWVEAARLAGEGGDRLSVNLVQVYAVVTDRDREPREDLEREDFTLLAGDERLEIERFARAEDVPLRLGLALDTSMSMQERMGDLRSAAAEFLETTLEPRDRVFLVDFASRPRLAAPPTDDLDAVLRGFGSLHSHGFTALYDAIVFSLLQFEHSEGRKALLVITDGEDSRSILSPERCIRQARELGVPIYIISLGAPVDPNRDPRAMLIAQLANETGGRLYNLYPGDDPAPIYERIRAELRSQYLLGYSSDNALSASELADLRVETRDKRLNVRTVVAGRWGGR